MSSPRNLLVEFAPQAGPFDIIDGQSSLQILEGTEGLPGSGASTPDSAALSIVGDIDIRCEFSQGDDRTIRPALVTKWDSTSDERSWFLWISGDRIAISWSTDGTLTNSFTRGSIAIPDYDRPFPLAIRATLDVDNGAAGHTARFYTSDSIDGTWTQLGDDDVTSGTTSIYDSTADVQVGNRNVISTEESRAFKGRIYAAYILDGIGGTVVGNPDFRIQTPGDTSFADTASSPNTWTINAPAEIVGSDWVDVSSRVLSATWTFGRDNELDSFPAGTATVILKNDDRLLDPDYTAGTYYGQLLPRVPFRFTSNWSSLRLAASSGANVTTPDHASLEIPGDLDVRLQLSMDDWTPGGFGVLLAGQTGSSQESWVVGITAAGNLTLVFTTDGSTDLTRTSTAATGFIDGSDHWIRYVLDVNNGAAGHDVYFYTSSDGVTWTQLGTTVTTAGTVTLFNSTASLYVGSPTAGLDPTCSIRYFEVRAGIDGTAVASTDYMELEPGDRSFIDTSGKTWTVNGTASVEIDADLTTDEFYGFVEGGWEQELFPPEQCNCTVTLVDRLEALGGYALPDVFDQSVLVKEPTGYWVLDQADAADAVADLSDNGHDGTVIGQVTFGERPIVDGHAPSALFTADFSLSEPNIMKDYVEITSGSPLLDLPGSSSIVATFRARTPGTLNFHTLFIQSDGNVPTDKSAELLVGTQAQLTFLWSETGGGIAYDWTEGVVDGAGHIVFAQGDGIAVDTATLSTSAISSLPGQPVTNGVGIGSHSGINDEDNWDGWVGAVAIYNRLLTENERISLLTGYTKLSGETSDVHIDWALDRLAVPAEFRNLDTGSIVMGSAEAKGQDTLEWIRKVADTEQGGFYADHRDGGKFRFVERYRRFTSDRSTAVQYNFSDNKTSSSPNLVRVERADFNVLPNGVDSILNQANVAWQDGTESISDGASIARYGPRPRDISTEATSPQQARSVGEWLVVRYASPRTRIDALGIYPGADHRSFRATYHLQIGDRVQVQYHPQEVGDAVTHDLFVEGVEQRLENGVNWYARYNLSPVDTFTPWIWGESLWDETTYWG